MSNGWVGVDLDGTLAKYDQWRGELHIGEPIPLMVNRIKEWRKRGIEVRIFTARVSTGAGDRAESNLDAIRHSIEQWCLLHIGEKLSVTCCKDFGMIELWDDRCVQVMRNTGKTVIEFAMDKI